MKTAPVDRDSLLGRYLGDRRFALTLPRAVGLQILHPSVAAAIVAHAPSSLWAHKKRTVSRMIYLAYTLCDPHPAILYGHGLVHGVDSRGKRYSGLTPELFFFQHATYVDTLYAAIETFDRPLSLGEKKTLYAECCEWYRRYGISARHMPRTWADFNDYLKAVCATDLAVTPESGELAPELLRPDAWVPRVLPDFAVRTLLHARTRELLRIPLQPADRAAMSAYANVVKTGMRVMTSRARLVPAARA
ncbi:oxygenase MpaB family protein [Nocardia abscessus]|uniref:oxygenase MpaB family protein n=1 Tax=Nocardia abscessus TaxID=120957 RepID=UPI0024561C0B|nr:oxygenase MpaB family protein [Nocardia abscessus]